MNTPVSKKETVGIDRTERQVVKLSAFEHEKSTVKIVAAINTVPFSEYCYSFCDHNILAPFGEKNNANQENWRYGKILGCTTTFLMMRKELFKR